MKKDFLNDPVVKNGKNSYDPKKIAASVKDGYKAGKTIKEIQATMKKKKLVSSTGKDIDAPFISKLAKSLGIEKSKTNANLDKAVAHAKKKIAAKDRLKPAKKAKPIKKEKAKKASNGTSKPGRFELVVVHGNDQKIIQALVDMAAKFVVISQQV